MADPIPMILTCPQCGGRHVDEGEFAARPHHTHACQGCGMVWRPAVVHTVGVRFLPGFRDGEATCLCPCPEGLCMLCAPSGTRCRDRGVDLVTEEGYTNPINWTDGHRRWTEWPRPPGEPRLFIQRAGYPPEPLPEGQQWCRCPEGTCRSRAISRGYECRWEKGR